MANKPFICSSFCGTQAKGNKHWVTSTGEQKESGRQAGDFVYAHTDSEPHRVEYWQNNRLIRRCGSGTIALAAYYFHRLGGCEFYQRRIATPSGPIELGYDEKGPYYIDQPLTQAPLQNRELWAHLSDVEPCYGAYAGGPGEYCIVICRHLAELRAAIPRLNQFALFSGRALIAASYANHTAHMRYFAPQYGQAEDAATGSAGAQLAAFLFRRLAITHINIRQHSVPGAAISCERVGPRKIRVRGRYRLLCE